jgi:hypothetical protein
MSVPPPKFWSFCSQTPEWDEATSAQVLTECEATMMALGGQAALDGT